MEDMVLDMVCLSPQRWDLAGQRPRRLMSRSARERRVFFVEQPIFSKTIPELEIGRTDCDVFIVTPHLPEGVSDAEAPATEQTLLLNELFTEYDIRDYILWYYTPAAIAFTWRLDPLIVVYDRLDESQSFKSKQREVELLMQADVVFTAEYSSYETIRRQHHNIHPFPLDEALSSIAWDDAWTRMMNLVNQAFNNRYSTGRDRRKINDDRMIG